jgi:hypothetical protein
MCAGYKAKYGHQIWLMPPVAPSRLMLDSANELPEIALRQRYPIIAGNIWGQHWLESLRATVRDSGLTLRWYNHGQFSGLPCSPQELAQDGIVPQPDGPIPDEKFVEILRQAPFVVLPSGTLDEYDDRRFIAQLNFPSRVPFIIATSHAPILVLGNPQTAGAQIVTRLGLGVSAPYERQAFLERWSGLLARL